MLEFEVFEIRTRGNHFWSQPEFEMQQNKFCDVHHMRFSNITVYCIAPCQIVHPQEIMTEWSENLVSEMKTLFQA